MQRLTRIVATLALLSGLLAATQAQAHGIWFAERSRQLALIYGVGADDLDSLKRMPLYRDVAAWDADWKPVPTALQPAGPIVVVDTSKDPVAVSAVMDNGIWAKTPAGQWLQKGRDEVPDAVVAEHTMKFAVRILKPLASPIPPLPQQTLQIVPIDATLPAHAGDPLKLRVLLDGKPLAGAAVKQDLVTDPEGKSVTSAADGTVIIAVRNQGLNVVSAVYKGPANDPKKVDHVEYLATLSFVLPHAPE